MARDDRNPDYLNQVKTSQTEKGSVITDFEYGSIRFKNAKLISTKKELLYNAVSTLTDKVYFFWFFIEHYLWLQENYSYKIYSPVVGKKMNKEFLQEKLGLTVSDKTPLIGFIGRFDSKQKGIELIHKMIRRVNLKKFQFIILGEGEIEWVERFNWLASFYEKSVAYVSGLASQIYSACDFLLIPSKYEPCGLIQMIAMRYGTLPIARATGGLKDSIIDGVDGFLFKNYSSFDLEKKLKYAVEIWRNNKVKYKSMVLAAMTKDFSWNKSAKEYINLYQKLLTTT